MLDNFRSPGAIDLFILWSPGAQAVHVTIAHAEYGGDKNYVVNLPIGGAEGACGCYVVFGDMLSPLLHFAGDVEQCL